MAVPEGPGELFDDKGLHAGGDVSPRGRRPKPEAKPKSKDLGLGKPT